MKIKVILTSLLALIATVSLSACSSKGSDSNAQVNKIKEAKVLKVGLQADYPPFEFQSLQNGKNQIVGSDIDLANAISKKLGVKLEIVNMSFNNVLSSLQAGKIDLGISGITATKEREKAFDFSEPYYTADNYLLVKKSDLNKYQSIDDLKGKTISAQKGSVQEKIVKEQLKSANLVSLSAVNDEINEVKAGLVQGAVIENLIAKSYVAQNPDLAIVDSVKLKTEDASYAVAMSKDSGNLKKEVDEVIKQMKASGELEKSIDHNYSLSQAK
ncbi:transporter substrate-binding domain-containing protein [Lactococcus termiticola]|uniref:Amino acid ABC transporter substrate-binding protein n=1 Tax=Lactococcus termiticola TaxID=2169526 RepID=A0A2R5HF76_9LACT|nr:transporter substrate-binding domain-containing protein [Lactococcus termiticola]GBG95945.1 amino acid ABC transporter substrate-binding protein [Lactococcus termiticola]